MERSRRIRLLLLGILTSVVVIALCVVAIVVLLDWFTSPMKHPAGHRTGGVPGHRSSLLWQA